MWKTLDSDIHEKDELKENDCIESRISQRLKNMITSILWDKSHHIKELISEEVKQILRDEWVKRAFVAKNILESFTEDMVNLQDENHIILECNEAFSKFVWFPKREIIWKSCRDIICDPIWCKWKCPIDWIKVWNTDKYLVEFDWRFLEKSAQMVFDDCWNFIWIVEIYKDRSEIINKNRIIEDMNNSLMKTNELLSSALENSKQWVWEWDFTNWEINVDEHYYRILWYTHEEILLSYEKLIEMVHPDDKAFIAKEKRLIIRWKKDNFQITHRVKNKSGEYIWVTISWNVCEKNTDNTALKAVWTLMDITSSVDIEKILLDKEKRLEAIVKSLPELLLIIDKEWNYKEIKSWNSKIFFWVRKIWMNIKEVFDKKNSKNILNAISTALVWKEVQNIKYSLESDWKNHYFEWNVQALNEDQVLIITREVTEDKELQMKLKKLATRDSLTSLFNAWTFIEMLKVSINNARRLEKKLAVLFIDLDNFKSINDVYGHSAWDAILKEVADRLLSATRWTDIVSRMWWDEFTVILNKIDWDDDAVIVIERIYNSLMESYNLKWEKINVWSSLGFSMFPEHWETVEELMENADVAMYKVKWSWKWNYTIFEINKSN